MNTSLRLRAFLTPLFIAAGLPLAAQTTTPATPGPALTIFTEQLLDDLGASNLNDVLNFAPNTDSFVNTLSDTTGNGNNFINVATQYVARGGATSVVGQDFFSNDVPGDRFNSEAFTFSRGPNAIRGVRHPAHKSPCALLTFL